MGNWRTVTMIGSVPEAEAPKLRDAVLYDYMATEPDYDKDGPLAFSPKGSLCGIHEWVAPEINAGGNLSERDYSPEDVADHLRRIVTVAPGLDLKVHCGDDWESETCIATITVHAGEVTVGPPEVENVTGVAPGEAGARMLRMMMGG